MHFIHQCVSQADVHRVMFIGIPDYFNNIYNDNVILIVIDTRDDSLLLNIN